MSGGWNSEIKERIDTDKNFSIDMNEINGFIFDEKEWTNNLNELGNYLNWLSPMEIRSDVIRRALMIYFTSSEWWDISKWIEKKINSNEPLEKKEIILLYLQMINISSSFNNNYSSNNNYTFDPSKPIGQICWWKLLTFIRTSYISPWYNPQESGINNITNNFHRNQNKDKYGIRTWEIPTNIEIPQIPELKEDNLDYVHNYCFELIKRAKKNYYNEVNRICYDAWAKHYDQSKQDIPEFARYDVLLFAYEKYCEIISKNHEKLITWNTGAWYKDVKEFEQQVDELNKFSEEAWNKFPNLEEISLVLQEFSQELENNRNKYFKNEEEVDKAGKDFEDFNDFSQKKSEEYKIDEIVKSFEKDPENEEEAMNYFKWMNILLEYQNELNEKSESYWGNVEKYQQYIQWNIEISKRYPQIKEYIEIQQQYSDFLESWWNKIDFEKIQKYNELRENTGIDKDFNNMSVLGKVILDPTNEYFPILWVKNAQAEKEKKIDTFRNKLEKNFPLAYWTLNSISWLWNGFIAWTISVWTSLWYMILSLCEKDKSDLYKRKQFYDNLLAINQSSKQKEAIYDSSTHSLNFNYHNWVATVSSSISQMFCLIYWWWTFAKWIGKITWISTKIAGKAWLFSFAFINQIWQSYVEANLNGLEWWKALAYSTLSAFVQSSVELLSPNEVLLWWWNNITQELIRNLVKDWSERSFTMLWKIFLKNVLMEIVEENIQEALQLAAGNLINMYIDGKRWTKFWADWSWENFAQTAIITTLTTWITTWTSYMVQMRNMNASTTSTLFNEVINDEWTYTAVMEMLNKAIAWEIEIPDTDMWSLQQLKAAFQSVNDVWANLHEERRNTRLNEDWTYEPRIKTTQDQVWIEQHNWQTEVDIANTTFENPPSDWQHENLEAAKVAESLVFEAFIKWEDISTEMIEDMSSKVHEEWLKRNTRAKWWDLDVPYSQLPELEKAKYRNQVLLAINVTKQNLQNSYFGWKSHKFNVTESQARSNSETMDNILNEVNEQNKSEKLNELRNKIKEQYKQATWEEIELSDEQLLSILDTHEQNWVLWELTKPQLTQKVRTLSESITDSNIRRFLLEAWFCGSIFWYSFKNIFNKSGKFSIWQQVSILTKSDNSIVYDAYIKSFNQGIWKYMVTRYQNWRLTWGRFSAEELNNLGQLQQKDNFTEKIYALNQQELWNFYNSPQTRKSQTFLNARFLPKNKIILLNSTLYITDKIIDVSWRPIIIWYTMEWWRFNLRLFYRSMSEWCRRACPWMRSDKKYSKWEHIPNASYETTTKLNPKIWNSFDNLNEQPCRWKPIIDISKRLLEKGEEGVEILWKEMEKSTTVMDKLFPNLQSDAFNFYKNKNSSLVMDWYKNLVPDWLKYKRMVCNSDESYSYYHDYLWQINVQVCSMKWNGKKVNVHFAHAKNSPNKVWIDNIVYSDAKINSFWIYDKQINAWPLVAKPIDYNSQVPIDFRSHRPIWWSSYIDIRDLYQENPIIKRYKRKILNKKMYS